jgi:hypothetical protein
VTFRYKKMLLLLHVIPVLNKTGPTHTQIRYMIFVFFVFYSIFQKKITFDEILKFFEDEQFKYLVLESINDKYLWLQVKNET